MEGARAGEVEGVSKSFGSTPRNLPTLPLGQCAELSESPPFCPRKCLEALERPSIRSEDLAGRECRAQTRMTLWKRNVPLRSPETITWLIEALIYRVYCYSGSNPLTEQSDRRSAA